MAWWKAWIKQLADEGYLQYVQVTGTGSKANFQIVEVAPKGRAFLANPSAELDGMVASQALVDAESATRLEQQRADAREEARKFKEKERAVARSKEEDLYQALLALRGHLAEKQAVAAYSLLSEVQLRSLARIRPSTVEALNNMDGWSTTKIQNLGQPFIDLVNQQADALGLRKDIVLLRPSFVDHAAPANIATDFSSTPALKPTMIESYRLFMQEGKSISDIANDRPRPIQVNVGELVSALS